MVAVAGLGVGELPVQSQKRPTPALARAIGNFVGVEPNSEFFNQYRYFYSNVKVADISEIRGVKPIDKTRHIRSEVFRDIKLEKAIIKATDNGYSEVSNRAPKVISRYFYNGVDLNGDKKPEVVVHLYGPYFCGTGGCTTMIFRSVGREYRLVSNITVSKPPIIVTNQRTKGWNNLIILASGGGRYEAAGYYLLRFDGKNYPNTPDEGTKIRQRSIITGKTLMVDIDSKPGIVLPPN